MSHTRAISPVVLVLLGLAAMLSGCQSRMVVGRAIADYKPARTTEPATPPEAAKNETKPSPEPVVESAMKEPETPPVEAKSESSEPAEPAPEVSVPAKTVEAPAVTPRSSAKRRAEGVQESPYVLDLSFGGQGLSEGLFDTPVAIAVDENENMYVLDQNNQRVQCFDQYGDFSFAWGEAGAGGGEYEVTDVNGVPTLRMTGRFDFNYPSDIILEPDDRWDLNRVTVTDTINHRIQRFLVKKDEFDTFPEDVFVMLPKSGTTTFPDTDLMSRYETEGTRVILDPVYLNDGKADPFVPMQYVWGGLGFSEDNFNRPTGMTRDDGDLLYVADTGNRRVLEFYVTPQNPVSDTEYYFQLGNDMNYPYGEGRLNEPTAVAYDNTDYGSVLVLDKDNSGNFNIQRFSKDGEFMGLVDLSKNPAAKPRYPVDIVLNSFDNTIFISDKGYRSVMVYNNKGEFMFSIGGKELKDPRGIAVLSNGYVYVTDGASNMVYRYVPR